MPKASHIQTSFNAGELSPSLEGRTDFQKYAAGCRQLENFLPTVQGGIVKRSGTRFLKEVKDSSKETRLIPFEFSTTQAYILEFGHQYMRVYVHGAGGIPGVVLEPNPLTPTTTFSFTAISTGSPPQITTTNPHPFEAGDEVYIQGITSTDAPLAYAALDSKFFKVVEDTGANTFTIQTTDETAISGLGDGASAAGFVGRVFTLTTPYDDVDLASIQYAQSADTMYLGHLLKAPRKLTRTDHYVWTMETLDFEWQPFLDENLDTGNLVTIGSTDHSVAPPWESGVTDPIRVPADRAILAASEAGGGEGGPDTTLELTLISGHGFLDNDLVAISGITGTLGTDETNGINGKVFRIRNSTTATVDLYTAETSEVLSTGSLAWASGGTLSMRIPVTSGDGVFTAAMVGGYFKVREILASHHGPWAAGDDLEDYDGTIPNPGAGTGDLSRYYEGNVYELTERNVGGTLATGTSPPLHEFGIETDGKWKWQYLHSGEGYVKITHYFSPNRVAATISKRIPVSTTWQDALVSSIAVSMGGVVTVTTTAAHNLVAGDLVCVTNVRGSGGTETGMGLNINGNVFMVGTVDIPTTFTVNDTDNVLVDGGSWGAFSAGGIVTKMITQRWSHGAWSGQRGFPRTVTFFEDRLWWASTDASTGDPQTLWASKTSEYESHQTVALDESALILTLNTDQVNAIQWINAGKQLMVGTVGGEFLISGFVETEAITPRNVRAVRHGTYGSQINTKPLRVGPAVLFVQRAGKKLRELVYDDVSDSYVAPDLTVLSDHITRSGIKYMAFQQEPHRIIWTVLEDKSLIGFTYERDQQVTAWHRHVIGGTTLGTDEDEGVESVAVIPHSLGTRDEVFLIVKRMINGAVRRYIEYLEPDWISTLPRATDEAKDAFFVDSGVTLVGDPVGENLIAGPGSSSGASETSAVLQVTSSATPGAAAKLRIVPSAALSDDSTVFLTGIEGIPELNGLKVKFTAEASGGPTYTEYDLVYMSSGDAVDTAGFASQEGVAAGTTFASQSASAEVVETATVVKFLDHLEGETVSILADGASHPDKVVSSGQITLERAASFVSVGLPYTATMESMRIEAGAADGTAQGKIKRITDVTVRLYQTGPGLFVGPIDGTMDEFHMRKAGAPDPTKAEGRGLAGSGSEMDFPIVLYDGDTQNMSYPEGYTQHGRVAVQHRLPFPCTVIAIMPQLLTQDR